jgi:hypothetical protein
LGFGPDGVKNMMKRLPPDYACQIMVAVTDGLGMAIRLKTAGACIRIMGIPSSSCLDPAATDGSGRRKKRGRNGNTNASSLDGSAQQPSLQRPIFSDAIDFGNLREEDYYSGGDGDIAAAQQQNSYEESGSEEQAEERGDSSSSSSSGNGGSDDEY